MKMIKFIDVLRGQNIVAIRPEEIYHMQEYKYFIEVKPALFSKVNGTRDPKTGIVSYDYKKESEPVVTEHINTTLVLKNGLDFCAENKTIADIEKMIADA